MTASQGLGPRSTRHDGRTSTQGPSSGPAADTSLDDSVRPPVDHPLRPLDQALSIEGALLALLVDGGSGMPLERAGKADGLDPEILAAGMTDVVRSQLRTMQALGVDDRIEDMLISAADAYYLARCVKQHPGVFVLLVLERDRANLAMARHRLGSVVEQIEI